jgi:hypothetical protein
MHKYPGERPKLSENEQWDLVSFAAVRCLSSMGKTATQWAVREARRRSPFGAHSFFFRALELTYA